jgi:hypothetical protein
MLPVEELFLLLIVAALIWYWVDSLRAREIAMRAASQACSEEGLQLLDETVSGQKIRLRRNDEGVLGLERIFAFEFTDNGNNRQRGSLTLEGGRVALLHLRPQLYIVPRQSDGE